MSSLYNASALPSPEKFHPVHSTNKNIECLRFSIRCLCTTLFLPTFAEGLRKDPVV